MPTGRSTADVLIIGGGVIGLTTAYALARDGARVTLLDRQDFGRESSWAGAGIISPGNPERAATPYARLRAISAARYPSLAAELRERTGIDPGYRTGCKLTVVDETGKYIESDTLYLHQSEKAQQQLRALLARHSIDVIAISHQARNEGYWRDRLR